MSNNEGHIEQEVLNENQLRIWEKVYEIAQNQWSPFEGRIDKDGFIEWCLGEFHIQLKKEE